MCVCVCVHVCVYVHVWMYMYVCTCMHVHVFMYMYVCTCMYVFTCMHVPYMYVHVCMYIYDHVCTCRCGSMCICVHIQSTCRCVVSIDNVSPITPQHSPAASMVCWVGDPRWLRVKILGNPLGLWVFTATVSLDLWRLPPKNMVFHRPSSISISWK